MKRSALLIAGAVAVVATAGTQTLYVAPCGDDSAAGTAAAPFKSIARARDAARATGGAKIVLADGVYETDKPLTFTAADAHLLFVAADGAKPVVSAGRRIVGWKVDAKGWWRAQVPKGERFAQFYVDGQRRTRPFLPRRNYHYLASGDGGVEPETGRQRVVVGAGAFPEGDNPDMEMCLFHTWTMSRSRVLGYDAGSRLVTLGIEKFTRGYDKPNSTRWYRFDNVKSALGEPGDWYLDASAGELVYVPMPGETPGKCVTVASRHVHAVRFDDANDIVFRGVAFAYSDYGVQEKGNYTPQAASNQPGAIHAENSKRIRFENCAILHTGAYGAVFTRGSEDCALEGCELADLGAGGVRIGDGWEKTRKIVNSRRCVVRNCIVEDGGRVDPAGVGVWIGHGSENLVSHNTIHDMYYSGVSLGWNWAIVKTAYANVIEWNDIYDIGQQVLSDMGGIYMLGCQPGTVVRCNRIRDVWEARNCGFGIYFDSGSSFITVSNNVATKCSFTDFFVARISASNRVENNVFACAPMHQVYVPPRDEVAKPTLFARNVVWHEGPGAIADKSNGTAVDFRDNLLWRGENDMSAVPKGFVLGNPCFADPQGGDFRMTDETAARSVGFVPFSLEGCGRTLPRAFTAGMPAVPRVFTAAPKFALVGRDSQAEVVLPRNAEESSKLAAAEITNHVYRLTGRKLAVREDDGRPPAGGQLWIGTVATLPNAPDAVLDSIRKESRRQEAAWLGMWGDTMWIVGKEEVAELYAAYYFLESKLGIRWFKAATAEDPGDYVPPRRDEVLLQPWMELHEPAFSERKLDMCAAAPQIPAKNAQACAVRNGYQINCSQVWFPKDKVKFKGLYEFFAPRVARRRKGLGGGHLIFAQVWPPDEKHFAEHPEYFALVDGKRVMGRQYCYSNTNLLNLAADRTIGKLNETGGLGQYCYALWDTATGACQCENCVAMATAEETQKGIESTRFHKFVNVMSDRIYAAWPNANLLYLAYWTYRRPAVGVPHDPRMPVQYCMHERCYGHDLADPTCSRNAVRLKELKEWTAIAPYVFTYEYFSATPSLYCCNELTHARDLKFYGKLGLAGWKEEALFSDSYFVGGAAAPGNIQASRDRMTSNWQRYYVCGHLSWNLELDERKLLDEAESLYYGCAYPAMRKYQALRRRLWDLSPNGLGYPTGDQRTATLLNTAGAKEELLGLLDEAEKLAAGDAVRLSRVRLDRRWLSDYWIKPNDALRAKAGKTLRAPCVAKPPVVDGSGADDAWAGAAYAEDFATAGNFADKGGKPIPAELATSVGVVVDDANFYFLVSAKEPQPGKMKLTRGRDAAIWSDDAVELFLYPPAMDNRYYHVAVNALGEVYDARCPGNETACDLGVEAKGRVLGDRYVLEVKVPAANMHPLKIGETWQFLAARNRKVQDGVTPKGGGWTIGGAGYHDTLAYRSLVIGAGNGIRNGSFDQLKDDGAPKFWALTGKGARVEDVGGNKLLHLTGDVCYQYALGQKTEPRRISYTFRAKGTGSLKTFFYSFTDTPNARAKHGYDRKFNKNHDGGRFALSTEWKSFTAEFEIPANETCGLAFSLGGKGCEAFVDDVSVAIK